MVFAYIWNSSAWLCAPGNPECGGDSQLVAGESTKLTCKLPYSGTSSLSLAWTRDGRRAPGDDESGFGDDWLLSASSVSVSTVGPDDDGAEYRCEISVGDDVVHRYSATLDVACT